jgi:hypothetical protein
LHDRGCRTSGEAAVDSPGDSEIGGEALNGTIYGHSRDSFNVGAGLHVFHESSRDSVEDRSVGTRSTVRVRGVRAEN